MMDFTHPENASASLPLYRGKPHLNEPFTHLVDTDDAALSEVIERAGLFMKPEQLRLCLIQLKKEHATLTPQTLYLLDSLCELHTTHPHTQTLIGFDTDSPDRANALSALIDHCRSIQGKETTPPLQLRTILDTISASLCDALPPCPYDSDASLHFSLCDALHAAALPANGYIPTAQLSIAGSELQLIAHEPHRQSKGHRIVRGDRVCLLSGVSTMPSEAECAAAQAFFTEIQDRRALRSIVAVHPGMLLPTALQQVNGLSVDTTHLPCPDHDGAPFPYELVRSAPGGWLVFVDPAEVPAIEKLCAEFSLCIVPFATVRSDRVLEISAPNQQSPLRLPCELIRCMQFAYSYRMIDSSPVAEVSSAASLTPLFMRKHTADLQHHLTDASGCGAWFVRTVTIPLDGEFSPQALKQAIQSLQQALKQDGCTQPENTALLCGWEVTPTLSRKTLWQSVLQLYHEAKVAALRCLPIALQHAEQGFSRMTLTALCHKPYPDARNAVAACEPADHLPLPADCSLLHAPHPEALIAYTPDATEVEAMAAALDRAGAVVHTLRLKNDPATCTALADAIHAARLVLFVGDAPMLSQVLTHRRVQYALTTLIERDGLCLAQGAAVCALCHTGLFDELLSQLPTCTPQDAFDGAFPFAVSHVRDLNREEDALSLRALPDTLLLLRDDIPVGDPMVELFRSPEAAERNILAITQTQDGTPAAVRLVAAGGHLLAYADGFTASHLRKAVEYFQ